MRVINLDFRPEKDVNEYFYLRVINLTAFEKTRKKINYEGDWENLYLEFSSSSRLETVKEIERLLIQTPPFKG